jgi:DNA adenine methylase
MVQLALPVRIVNVASVPQRSPFRYPGGKTWLVPEIRDWLGSQGRRPQLLIEPFAGGGIVSLTAVFENFVEHAVMIELDEQVASVWLTILSDGWSWLAERILNFVVTQETVQQELTRIPQDTRERAFQTVLRNRVVRAGILAPGANVLRYGEGGKGLASRWYPDTLARRIRDIARLRERFTFIHGDGLAELQRWSNDAGAVFFIDPPYSAGGKRAGERLYTHSEINHRELFRAATRLVGDFLMTYDDAPEVRRMARGRNLEIRRIAMHSSHHVAMIELLIGRNLAWVR